MDSTIVLQDIIKKFDKTMVLENISFEIKSGEIFGLLGPSGAGKTTMIKIITGQIRSDSGSSFINGRNSHELSGRDFKNIGIMMDNFGVYERLSCFGNLKIFADIYKISKERIHEVLAEVGLGKAVKTIAGNLSKGMLSRLKLARVFLIDPSVIFLDEPTSALDPATAEEIHQMILNEKRKGKTIFLTTHNMTEAEKLCDNIALLHCGNILEYGNPNEICRRYNHQKRIRIHLADGKDMEIPHDRSAADIVGRFLSEGTVETIHSTEPNLETVFMELTGKALAR